MGKEGVGWWVKLKVHGQLAMAVERCDSASQGSFPYHSQPQLALFGARNYGKWLRVDALMIHGLNSTPPPPIRSESASKAWLGTVYFATASYS